MDKDRIETDQQDLPLEVLVVDDESAHADAVAGSLERIGVHSMIVHSEKEACETLRTHSFDVVVTDLMLEKNDGGLEVLACVKQESPETEVIVMTAYSGVETAVEAMRNGAFNYLQKPLDLKQLRTIVEKAGESAKLRRINRELKRRLDEKFGFDGVIGNSPEMLRIIERMKRVAPTDASVLIRGETGTGKELFAQALHQNSMRQNKPFVALNCAALTENILESELFGHVKGAFTDALDNRVGKFEYANGGTLFLDEVGDMPLSTQSKLLRVLENEEVTRVGANEIIKINVRIISATNRSLEEMVAENTFRQDLYHRLKVVTLTIPPLRERRGDIPMLLEYFIRSYSKKYSKTIKGMTSGTRRKLFQYDWPGNVRQLRNTVESMVVVDIDGLLDIDDLPDDFAESFSEPVMENKGNVSVIDGDSTKPTGQAALVRQLVGMSMVELENMFIRETLDTQGGNREETAKLLGIGERTLYRKIKEISPDN